MEHLLMLGLILALWWATKVIAWATEHEARIGILLEITQGKDVSTLREEEEFAVAHPPLSVKPIMALVNFIEGRKERWRRNKLRG